MAIDPKEQINEKIKQLYVFQANLEENAVKKEKKKLYKDAVTAYGTWEKVLKANGINKRKLREREKFILYFMIKGRIHKFGKEVLRPKNVTPEDVKDRIVAVFKTMKALAEIINTPWDENHILFELHACFLTGHTIESVEEDEAQLFQNMIRCFGNVENAIKEYDMRFGIPSVRAYLEEELEFYQEEGSHEREIEQADEDLVGVETETKLLEKEEKDTVQLAMKEEKPESQSKVDTRPSRSNAAVDEDLINMLIKLNYVENEEDVIAMKEANNVTREEIVAYLFGALVQVQLKGIQMDEGYIKTQNARVFYAIKAKYGSLENALTTITQGIVKQA